MNRFSRLMALLLCLLLLVQTIAPVALAEAVANDQIRIDDLNAQNYGVMLTSAQNADGENLIYGTGIVLEAVSMRSAPSWISMPVYQLNVGDVVTVYAESFDSIISKDWHKVVIGKHTGYIQGKYIDLVPAVVEQEIQRNFGKQTLSMMGIMPNGSELSVSEALAEQSSLIAESFDFDELEYGDTRMTKTLDLSVLSEGVKWQPTDGAIQITIEGFAPGGDRVNVIHLLDTEFAIEAARAAGILMEYVAEGLDEVFPAETQASGDSNKVYYTNSEATINENGDVTFSTESFSTFHITVDFDYSGHVYVVEEQNEFTLSELFEKLSIEKDVSTVKEISQKAYQHELSNNTPVVINATYINIDLANKKLSIPNAFNARVELKIVFTDNSSIVIQIRDYRTDQAVYYLDLDQNGNMRAVSASDYESMKTAAQNRYNANDGENIPIKNWKRSGEPYESDKIVTEDKVQIKEGQITYTYANGGELSVPWDVLNGIPLSIKNHVWDGSTLVKNGDKYAVDQYSIRLSSENVGNSSIGVGYPKITAIYNNGKPELYDSATWRLASPNAQSKEQYTLYRFQGEFTITNNPHNYEYYVGNLVGGEGTLHMNDDMFIFVYPKGKALSNDTNDANYFMKYFACWTGTSYRAGSAAFKFFNGVPSAQVAVAHQQDNAWDTLTDGWKMTNATTPITTVIQKCYDEWFASDTGAADNCELVIDIFCGEAATDGGMYRPVLKSEKVKDYVKFDVYCDDHGKEYPVGNAKYEMASETAVEGKYVTQGNSTQEGILELIGSKTHNGILTQPDNVEGFKKDGNSYTIGKVDDQGNYSATLNSVTTQHNNETNRYPLKLQPAYESKMIFKANQGSFADSSAEKNIQYCVCGWVNSGYELPTRAGYKFAGWKVTAVSANCNWELEKLYGDEICTRDILLGKYGIVTLEAQWEAVYSSLTIAKEDADLQKDPGHAFIFDVVGTPDDGTGEIRMKVVIDGNGKTTIDRLPVGVYTVTEADEWSWRYSASSDRNNNQVTLTSPDDPQTITFSNTRAKGKWLDGNAATKENIFGQLQASGSVDMTNTQPEEVIGRMLTLDEEDDPVFMFGN